MPCSDSSSSIAICLDKNERFVSFDFAKITCGREITGSTGFEKFCIGKTFQDILDVGYADLLRTLNLTAEEEQYILYLEWDALRSAIAQYLGADIEGIDRDRCKVTSVTYDETGIEIAEVILPPQGMPKILPCNLANN